MPRKPPSINALKDLLDDAYDRFARPEFIVDDPVQVPRSFARREDAEIMAFLTATIAWGQRKAIIANARRMCELLEGEPHAFVMSASPRELERFAGCVHRTFMAEDLRHFVRGLRHLHHEHGGLEPAFLEGGVVGDMGAAIARFKQRFFAIDHAERTRKHVADPSRGSNAKRINMFLRWMVRPADRGIDLGLWKRIPANALHVPLDVHTGRTARALGLLHRGQDDWKSVIELTEALRQLDPVDPIRYDIALFALGVQGVQRPQTSRVVASRPNSSVARSR